MIVRLGIGDAEADWDQVEKCRIGQLYPRGAEVVPGMEPDLVAPRPKGRTFEDGAVHSAVRIGRHGLDVRRGAVKTPQLDPHALSRPPGRGVKDMRRQTPHFFLPCRLAGLLSRTILKNYCQIIHHLTKDALAVKRIASALAGF